MSEYERIEAVKRRANQIEEKARMQEKLLDLQKVKGGAYVAENPGLAYQENVEQTIAVNDMYIDAIQAKLKILDQI